MPRPSPARAQVEARNNLVHKGLLWVDAVDKVGGATGLVVPGAARLRPKPPGRFLLYDPAEFSRLIVGESPGLSQELRCGNWKT